METKPAQGTLTTAAQDALTKAWNLAEAARLLISYVGTKNGESHMEGLMRLLDRSVNAFDEADTAAWSEHEDAEKRAGVDGATRGKRLRAVSK